MLRFDVLGRTVLTGHDGRPIGSVLHQPKRLALVAYLLLARAEFVRRDDLLGTFWGESDEARARNALNQAVHFIRGSLGPGAVTTRGADELGIARDAVRCDAIQFDDALAAGDLVGALGLYQGELLPGFSLDGCPGWQEWLDRERASFASRAAAAAWELSRREGAAGNAVASTQWARRAVEISPFDESAFRRLLGLLAQAGDRSGALLEYERFAERLREAFAEEPAPETVALAEAIRAGSPVAAESQGAVAVVAAATDRHVPDRPTTDPDSARAHASASPTAVPMASMEVAVMPEIADGAADVVSGSGDAAPAIREWEPSRRRRERRGSAVAAAVALVLLCGAVLAWVRATADAPPEPGPPRIVVQPFTSSGRGDDLAGVAGALTNGVAARLAQVGGFQVVREDLRPSAAGPGVTDDTERGGTPRMLVTGSIVATDGRAGIRYALVDAATGRVLTTDTLARPAGELLASVDGASQQIASTVRREIGRELTRSRLRAEAPDTATWRLLEEATWQQRRASALRDAGSVPAAQYALDAADSLLALAEDRAPRWIEPTLLRARNAEQLGWLYLVPPARDLARQGAYWGRGIGYATSALAIDPHNAGAWEIRGVLRFMLWGTSVSDGRPRQEVLDSAVEDLEKATRLDRTRARAWSILSGALNIEGRLAEAAEAAEQALASDRFLEHPKEILARLYTTSLDLGRDSAAVHWCGEIRQRYAGSNTAAYCTLGLLAWSDAPPDDAPADVWRIVRTVHGDAAARPEARRELEMVAAAALARRGQRDSALAVIQRVRAAAGDDAPPELLRFEALARATAGDRAGADALVERYARYNPTALVRLRQSRAFRSARVPERRIGRDGH